MSLNPPTANRFSCAFCGQATYRVIVRGKTSRQQAAGHGEVSMADYACTNRGHGQVFQVVECTHCQLRALWPMPAPTAIAEAYVRVKDEAYLTIEPSREVAFTKTLQQIERYVKPPGKLLDVGCYTGVFPLLATRAGWEAFGVEPSAWAADLAQTRLPGKIHQGYLDSAPFPASSFDVVTSWDVIEHVTDPREVITQMADALKPGGWLFLSTMSSQARVVKLLGARWPWYMPMHLFYFTPQSLAAFVQEAGLKPQAPLPYPHYTTVQYAIWKLQPYFGPLARFVGQSAQVLGFSQRIIKIDLGDFFLLAAQKASH